jgi:MYXO-CTERM domain-containing protein
VGLGQNIQFAAVYDSDRSVVRLFGASFSTSSYSPVAEVDWSNGVMSAVTIASGAPSFAWYATPGFYDPVGHRTVFFGAETAPGSGAQAVAALYQYTVAPSPVASPCAVDGDCTGGLCVDGVCCASACGRGDPFRCTSCNQFGSPAGTCAPASVGTACGAKSTSTCDLGGACEPGAGDAGLACVEQYATNGTACAGGTCAAGVCLAPPDGGTDAASDGGETLDAAIDAAEDASILDASSDATLGDAGSSRDAGSGSDGASSSGGGTPDAGSPGGDGSGVTSGCSCRSAPGRSTGGADAWLLALALLASRRRRADADDSRFGAERA